MHRLYFCLLLTGCPFLLSAQTDSVLLSAYSKIIPYYPDIYMGGQYRPPHRLMENSSLYKDHDYELGTVVVNGEEFPNQPIDYDVWYDVIVTINPIHRQLIILNHLKVDEFTLSDGTTFVKKEKAPDYYYHKNGFYRQIVDDDIGLYCKHWKVFSKRQTTFDTYNKYHDKVLYFIEKEGELIPINKKKDAFQILEANRKEVHPTLKKERVKFRRDKEAYLRILVEAANLQGYE
jgi:hypothetical protein